MAAAAAAAPVVEAMDVEVAVEVVAGGGVGQQTGGGGIDIDAPVEEGEIPPPEVRAVDSFQSVVAFKAFLHSNGIKLRYAGHWYVEENKLQEKQREAMRMG